MNFISQESPQKLRGGFYTAPDLARFLTDWVLEKEPASVLEPSCGEGVFLEALLDAKSNSLKSIFALELDPGEAEKARNRSRTTAKSAPTVEIKVDDFLKWFLFHGNGDVRFGGVVGNPPFIRYQYLSEQQQALAERIFGRFGLPFTKHTNAWVPFVLASIALLAPGGRLGMVLPSEIFHIPHARALRQFALEECARIFLFDPEELWFDTTQQGVVLLLAEKKPSRSESSQGVAVQPVQRRVFLQEKASFYLESADYVQPEPAGEKWMSLFLSQPERSLLQALRARPEIVTFGERATVDVGIVTGANKFFLVTDETVEAFELGPWAHPMFGRSEYVAGVIYGKTDHEGNRLAQLPTNFLWLDKEDARDFPVRVREYLELGEGEGLPKRFKCRVRQPWFRVPSVYATDVAMLKRCHHLPRLVFNEAGAFTTDTAYRIKPLTGSAVSLVYAFCNTLTCLSAELEGRHYGGGVLELVPSEIERLLLPTYSATDAQLRHLDHAFRNAPEPVEILPAQDRIVLGASGLTEADQDLLRGAWDRLRNRRQRNPRVQA